MANRFRVLVNIRLSQFSERIFAGEYILKEEKVKVVKDRAADQFKLFVIGMTKLKVSLEYRSIDKRATICSW